MLIVVKVFFDVRKVQMLGTMLLLNHALYVAKLDVIIRHSVSLDSMTSLKHLKSCTLMSKVRKYRLEISNVDLSAEHTVHLLSL